MASNQTVQGVSWPVGQWRLTWKKDCQNLTKQYTLNIYKKKNCARKQQTEVTFFSIPCGSFPNPLFQLLLSKWLGGLPLFTHSFLLSSISMWFPFAPDDTEEIVKFYFIFSSSFFILFDFASRVFRPVYVIRFLLYYKFSSFLSHDFLFLPRDFKGDERHRWGWEVFLSSFSPSVKCSQTRKKTYATR